MSTGWEEVSKNVVEAMSDMTGMVSTIGGLAEHARKANEFASTTASQSEDTAKTGVLLAEMVEKVRGTVNSLMNDVASLEVVVKAPE
jgi:methyl-accepting chemotaxis protein